MPVRSDHRNPSKPVQPNDRVAVFWPLEKKFFRGTIAAKPDDHGKVTVRYDDSDVEHLDLEKEIWKYCDKGKKGNKDALLEEDRRSKGDDTTPQEVVQPGTKVTQQLGVAPHPKLSPHSNNSAQETPTRRSNDKVPLKARLTTREPNEQPTKPGSESQRTLEVLASIQTGGIVRRGRNTGSREQRARTSKTKVGVSTASLTAPNKTVSTSPTEGAADAHVTTTAAPTVAPVLTASTANPTATALTSSVLTTAAAAAASTASAAIRSTAATGSTVAPATLTARTTRRTGSRKRRCDVAPKELTTKRPATRNRLSRAVKATQKDSAVATTAPMTAARVQTVKSVPIGTDTMVRPRVPVGIAESASAAHVQPILRAQAADTCKQNSPKPRALESAVEQEPTTSAEAPATMPYTSGRPNMPGVPSAPSQFRPGILCEDQIFSVDELLDYGPRKAREAIKPLIKSFTTQLDAQIGRFSDIRTSLTPRLSEIDKHFRVLRADIDNLESEVTFRSDLHKIHNGMLEKLMKEVVKSQAIVLEKTKADFRNFLASEIKKVENRVSDEIRVRCAEVIKELVQSEAQNMQDCAIRKAIESVSIPGENASARHAGGPSHT